MLRLSDLEAELSRRLTELLATGGSGNFLMVSAGPFYLQFAASPTDVEIHFEAVSNRFLPPEHHLDAMSHIRLEAAGFELCQNYERNMSAASSEDVAYVAREAVALLSGIYGCSPETELTIHLELEDIEHPTNESLLLALEAMEQGFSEETAAELFAELLQSTLLLPIEANGELVSAVDDEGSLIALAFTDYPSLLAMKADCGYQPMPGPALFARVLELGARTLIVSSAGEPMLELSREDLEALVVAASES